MAEEQSTEERARNLGWVPQEEFRGDPSRWISAESFLERGEHIMPILKANNERLQQEVAGLRGQISQFQTAINEGREAIEELKKFHTEDTEKKVQLARKNLLAELKAAKKEGDTDREVDLQGELSELDAALREERTPATAQPAPRQQPVIDPEFISWEAANPWFGVDKKRTALMTAAAEELRADPKNNGLIGRRFYEAASQEASRILDGGSRRTTKVEGGGASGGGSSAGGEGRSYADLPADAKEVCERQASKLVGPNKAFKTKAEWQKHYAEQYFA